MTHNKKLFLSAVSSEFAEYRALLAGDLRRPNVAAAARLLGEVANWYARAVHSGVS